MRRGEASEASLGVIVHWERKKTNTSVEFSKEHVESFFTDLKLQKTEKPVSHTNTLIFMKIDNFWNHVLT